MDNTKNQRLVLEPPTGEETARMVSRHINNMCFDPADFVDTMLSEHRTLQQTFTGLCLSWFSALAKQHDRGRFDGRNEFSCKIAKVVQEKIIDGELNGVTMLRCI